MQTPEEFQSLAATLLALRVPAPDEPAREIVEEPIEERSEPLLSTVDLLREVRLFRARLSEALDAAVERLLCDVACEVLARELEMAPVDVEMIVDRVLARYADEEPLRVRVHPHDAPAVQCGVPVVADLQLARGDAIVELRDGFIDATLGVRVEAMLQAFTP